MYRNGNWVPFVSVHWLVLLVDIGNDLIHSLGHHLTNSLRSVSFSLGKVLLAIRILAPGYSWDICNAFITAAVVLPLPYPPPNICILVRSARNRSCKPPRSSLNSGIDIHL